MSNAPEIVARLLEADDLDFDGYVRSTFLPSQKAAFATLERLGFSIFLGSRKDSTWEKTYEDKSRSGRGYRVGVDMGHPEGENLRFWLILFRNIDGFPSSRILATYYLLPHVFDYMLGKLDAHLQQDAHRSKPANLVVWVGNLMNYVRNSYPGHRPE